MRLKLYQWCASTATYTAPTKAWDGQPTFVNPGVDFFTPQTAATAQGMNYALKQHGANDASILDLVGTMDANNWPVRAFVPTGGALDGTHNGEIAKMAWDAHYARWLLWIKDLNAAGQPAVWTTQDGGKTATKLANVGSTGMTVRQNMAVRSTDGLIAVVQSSDAADCYTLDPTTNTVTTHTTSGPRGNRKNLEWFAGASLFIALAADATNSANAFNVGTSPDGTTWTDRTSGAAMTTTANMVPNNDYCAVAQSATTFAVFSTVTSSTYCYSTTNGTSWTAHTMPLLTGETVAQADYDTVNALWVLLVTNGTTTKLYTSPDLDNWTTRLVSTTTTYSGVAAGNGMYVVIAKGTPGTAGTSRAAYSTDQGATWKFCLGCSLPWMAGSYSLTGDLGERVKSAGGQQFAVYNLDNVNFSHFVGQSPAVL